MAFRQDCDDNPMRHLALQSKSKIYLAAFPQSRHGGNLGQSVEAGL